MKPIQLWLPQLCSSPFVPEIQRMRERAYSTWIGEDIVWVVPGLGEPRRALEADSSKVLALDGEFIERLDIFHVGENGYVWGPGMSHRFPAKHVNDLLLQWLNITDRPIYPAPTATTVMAPDPKLDGIQYREQEIHFKPVGQFPFTVTGRDEERTYIEGHWPPEGAPNPVVSVDQESREYFGDVRAMARIAGTSITGWIREDRTFAIGVVSGWPDPFDALIPRASGMDNTLQWTRMREIATKSETSVEVALREARDLSRSFLSEGVSSWAHAHFWPIYAREGIDGAIVAAATQFGLSSDLTFQELWSTDEWLDRAALPIPITRAWGGIGLMWALLLEQLERRRRFGHCEECGRVIPKRGGRRFCKRNENPDCVKRRARTRQGRHRSRRAS